MKRTALVSVLVIVLVLAMAAPALGLNASGGWGKMYGEHISSEAKAGTLGPAVHPGQHQGFHGWIMMQMD